MTDYNNTIEIDHSIDYKLQYIRVNSSFFPEEKYKKYYNITINYDFTILAMQYSKICGTMFTYKENKNIKSLIFNTSITQYQFMNHSNHLLLLQDGMIQLYQLNLNEDYWELMQNIGNHHYACSIALSESDDLIIRQIIHYNVHLVVLKSIEIVLLQQQLQVNDKQNIYNQYYILIQNFYEYHQEKKNIVQVLKNVSSIPSLVFNFSEVQVDHILNKVKGLNSQRIKKYILKFNACQFLLYLIQFYHFPRGSLALDSLKSLPKNTSETLLSDIVYFVIKKIILFDLKNILSIKEEVFYNLSFLYYFIKMEKKNQITNVFFKQLNSNFKETFKLMNFHLISSLWLLSVHELIFTLQSRFYPDKHTLRTSRFFLIRVK